MLYCTNRNNSVVLLFENALIIFDRNRLFFCEFSLGSILDLKMCNNSVLLKALVVFVVECLCYLGRLCLTDRSIYMWLRLA